MAESLTVVTTDVQSQKSSLIWDGRTVISVLLNIPVHARDERDRRGVSRINIADNFFMFIVYLK